MGALQELIEAEPGYTERITGCPPGEADAQSLLLMRPEGVEEDAKVVLGAFVGDRLVAVVDLIRGTRRSGRCLSGCFRLHSNQQGRGYGRTAYALAERFVEDTWPEIGTLRLAVVDTNAQVAAGFWEPQGFEATGEVRPYVYDKLESTARLYEKQLGE
ncbi:hypothetical protein PWY87_34935 [Kribbella solani]|uniref:GNAT family N-acetyltransferase n=1 Tax=Kribbella solani TaxID=236067 RepID=UPI0029B7553B|nr:GNAT family N-acetyltransferase [Kribbella solani]MDX3006913.1 hypothetical protein [Kribbella solani]